MDQIINSAVYVIMLSQSEPMNFPLSVIPSKEMGDHTRQKKTLTLAGIEPTTSGFDHCLITGFVFLGQSIY